MASGADEGRSVIGRVQVFQVYPVTISGPKINGAFEDVEQSIVFAHCEASLYSLVPRH